MVSLFRCSILLGAILLTPLGPRAADVPHYRVGDVATNDVTTPIVLVVTDPVATALLKKKEEREIRFIVRYCPAVADDAERAFRSHMALLREEFIRELTAAYGKSRVDKSVERTPKWTGLTDRFREEHKGNPKLFLYMPYWAQGRSDEHLLSDWIGHIRRAMDGAVRPDELPSGNIGSTVRMITVPELQVDVQLEHVERYGVLTPVDNVLPLSQVRRDMARGFPEGDEYIATFLGPFVQANCIFDEDLTRAARERHVDSMIVAANYAAGETIVRSGQVIDAKAAAALDQLRKEAPPQPKPNENAAVDAPPDRSEGTLNPWLMGGVAGGALTLIVFILMTRRKSTSMAVVRSSSPARSSFNAGAASHPLKAVAEEALDPSGPYEGESERQWRERALTAERRAEKARELARRKVTDALKDKVVEHLSTERDELIDHQLSAAEKMAGMEARLESIHGPLSERLKVYETRIAELEEQLAAKDEENRALIQAKIKNIRKQIAQAKVDRPFDWN